MSGSRALAPLLLAGLGGCLDLQVGSHQQALTWPAPAYCSVTVQGKGTKDVETDYLPHVITCENGGAEDEALRAQAVAARTFMYYKIAKAGSVVDGTSDQVYSCASQPAQRHLDAVKATSGQVLVWSSTVICGFFVAGGKPSAQSCVWASGDPDPTSTEKFVTYNDGKSGADIEQTTLGWVSPTNKENRGCFSQNGSRCLAQQGRSYQEMLRFYYGADIQIETASGSCVEPAADQAIAPADARSVDRAGKADAGGGHDRPPGADGWLLEDAAGPQHYATLRGGCSHGGSGADAGWAALAVIVFFLRWRRRRC